MTTSVAEIIALSVNSVRADRACLGGMLSTGA